MLKQEMAASASTGTGSSLTLGFVRAKRDTARADSVPEAAERAGAAPAGTSEVADAPVAERAANKHDATRREDAARQAQDQRARAANTPHKVDDASAQGQQQEPLVGDAQGWRATAQRRLEASRASVRELREQLAAVQAAVAVKNRPNPLTREEVRELARRRADVAAALDRAQAEEAAASVAAQSASADAAVEERRAAADKAAKGRSSAAGATSLAPGGAGLSRDQAQAIASGLSKVQFMHERHQLGTACIHSHLLCVTSP